MIEINNLLLEIYGASRNTSISEFSEKIFSLVKKEIHFDAAGFCDFSSMKGSEIKLVSAIAHNISVHEKSYARQKYIEPEIAGRQNNLATEDPALAAAFKHKGNAITLSINQDGLKSNVVSYGKTTDCYQTMVMAFGPPIPDQFQSLSLWRRKNNTEYIQDDKLKANIILPHVFQAFGISRQIHQIREVKDLTNGMAICSPSGAILFIDEVAKNFISRTFSDWNPPFLPSILFEKLRSTSEKIYIGKSFILTARQQENLLFLNFKKTTILENLSPTELVIAEMLVLNASYKAIAQKLGNQPATVRNQAHSIYSKFGISGKADLAKILNRTN